MIKVPPTKVSFPPEVIRDITENIAQILRSGILTLGEFTHAFEDSFRVYLGRKYAVAVNSGTAALEIVLRAWNVGRRDVIVPANTFIATAAAVWNAGGKVVLADVDSSLCLDAHGLELALTDNTVAVIVVHIGGQIAPDMAAIRAFCTSRNLHLLEDASHAHGSSLKGKLAGTFGDAAAFSFYPTKLVTSGEGGMIVTDDEELYETARRLRNHGKVDDRNNVHVDLGSNWRLSEFQSAVGLQHLRFLHTSIEDRRRVAELYHQLLHDLAQVTPLILPEHSSSNFYKYACALSEDIRRETLTTQLRTAYGVQLAGEVYALPIHFQPIARQIQEWPRFPNAERLCAHHICLPIYYGMTESETGHVVNSISKVLQT